MTNNEKKSYLLGYCSSGDMTLEDFAARGFEDVKDESEQAHIVQLLRRRCIDGSLLDLDALNPEREFAYVTDRQLWEKDADRFVQALMRAGYSKAYIVTNQEAPWEQEPIIFSCSLPPDKEIFAEILRLHFIFGWWAMCSPDAELLYLYQWEEYSYYVGPKGKIEKALPDDFWNTYHQDRESALSIDENDKTIKKRSIELIWAKRAFQAMEKWYQKIGFDVPPPSPPPSS